MRRSHFVIGFAAIAVAACLSGCDQGTAREGAGFTLLEGSAAPGASATVPVKLDNKTGAVFAKDFKVYWSFYEAWDQGGCVKMVMTNNGPPAAGWTLVVTFDGPADNWLHVDGGYVETYADTLLIQPEDNEEILKTGGRKEIYYCAEPFVRPAKIEVTVGYYPTTGTSGTSGTPSGGASYDWGQGEGWTSGPFNTAGQGQSYLRWGDFELYAATGNAWEGGGCVDMVLINNGPAISGWRLELALDQPIIKKTSATGGYFFAAGTHVLVWPQSAATLAAGGVAGLQFCGEPVAIPVAMRLTGQVADATAGSPYGDGSWGTGDSPTWGSTGNVPWTPPAGQGGKLVGDGDFLLYATDAGSWQGGHGTCVDLMLVNTGPPAIEWKAAITLDAAVTDSEIAIADGGDLAIEGQAMTITGDSDLDVFAAGEEKLFKYCAAPEVVPKKLVMSFTEAALPGATGGTGGRGSYPGTGYPGSGNPASSTFSPGTLWDSTGCFAAPYKKGVESNSGQCMSLQLLYVCQDEAKIDALRIGLSAGFQVTDSWPAVAYQVKDGGHDMYIAIPGYMASIEHHQSQVFTVCTKPLTKPLWLEVILAN